MVNGWMREHIYKNMVKDQTKNETNKVKNGCKNWRPHWTFQHFLAWTATRTQKKHRNKENKKSLQTKNKKQKIWKCQQMELVKERWRCVRAYTTISEIVYRYRYEAHYCDVVYFALGSSDSPRMMVRRQSIISSLISGSHSRKSNNSSLNGLFWKRDRAGCFWKTPTVNIFAHATRQS